MSMFERSIGCRDIRREIEDAGGDHPLSLEASSHLSSCGQCETLFDQHFKLREIVGSLGTVAAPNDFEFRLRARLAGEKRSRSQAPTMGSFSFGLRAAAFASIVLLVGLVMFGVGLRPGTNGPSSDVAQGGSKATVEHAGAPESTSKIASNEGNKAAARAAILSEVNPKGTIQRVGHRSGTNGNRLATASNRSGIRDIGKSSATVVRIDDLVAADGHTVFPIDAAPQSVKVSLDNGRGTPKTISAPGVSFGSQRTLSQNSSSPLVASSRGAW